MRAPRLLPDRGPPVGPRSLSRGVAQRPSLDHPRRSPRGQRKGQVMFTTMQRTLGALAAAALVLGLAGAARAQGPGRVPAGGRPTYTRPLPYQPLSPGLRPALPQP